MPDQIDEDIELLVDASLGGLTHKLHALFAKHKPSTFDQLVTVFGQVEPCEQMRRWSGMTEHPIAIRYRMKYSGQWVEKQHVWALARREAIDKNSRDPDVSAWKKLAEVYPPKRPGVAIPAPTVVSEIYEKVEKERPAISPELLSTLAAKGGALDPMADAIFTYQHLNDPDALARAPSTGAANMLVHARKNPDDFFKNIWPKYAAMLEKQKAGDGSRGPSAKEKRDIQAIKDMLEEAVAASKKVGSR